MTDINVLIDLFIFGSGCYITYHAFKMRKTREIYAKLLLSQNQDPKKCKDVDAYIAQVFPKLLLSGIIILLGGVVGLFNDFIHPLGMVYMLIFIPMLGTMVYMLMFTRKAETEFFGGPVIPPRKKQK